MPKRKKSGLSAKGGQGASYPECVFVRGDDKRETGNRREQCGEAFRKRQGISHMTARLSDWMTRNKIFRLADLERAVAAYQTDFNLISEHRRAVKKIETGMKYLATVERMKPIADKAKQGFKLIRERYAEEHADEIAEYNKAVRYLKANQMIPGDRDKYEARRDALLKEIARTEEKLRDADLDPEIIRTIRYQVEKVTEAGGIPEEKESVLGKLERYKEEAESQKRQGMERKKPVKTTL